MEQATSIEKRIQEILANDPLFQVIKDTPTEQYFLSEPYLSELIEKKFYSTPEVASWFDITDAQLRYYIKPLEHYIFRDDRQKAHWMSFPQASRIRHKDCCFCHY